MKIYLMRKYLRSLIQKATADVVAFCIHFYVNIFKIVYFYFKLFVELITNGKKY